MRKDEINERILHLHKIIHALRNRLQQRELQEAQQGINTSPEILTEIEELSERIQRHEVEVKQLQTFAVIDKEPLAEVEYRVILAETWDTVKGKPSVTGATKLELSRLRLGISPQRSQELEQEIRSALAKEAISNLNQKLLHALFELDAECFKEGKTPFIEFKDAEMEALRIVGHAIQLDYLITSDWLASRSRKPTDATTLRRAVNIANGYWRKSEDYVLTSKFADAYQAKIDAEIELTYKLMFRVNEPDIGPQKGTKTGRLTCINRPAGVPSWCCKN